MAGIWTWMSARSIDWCSRISSSTELATPMIRTVTLTAWSDSALIVSAMAVIASGRRTRSNSSKMTISDALVDMSCRVRLTPSGVSAFIGNSGGWTASELRRPTNPGARLPLRRFDILERLCPERRVGIRNVAIRCATR